jgi:hypothetical protein
MVDWQITATTIYCDAVDADTTIIVYKDQKVHCTGFQRYLKKPIPETLKQMERRSKKLGRKLTCEGEMCQRIITHRDKLFTKDR